MSRVLILGSAPNAIQARDWPSHRFDAIVAINNAWQVRPDWTHLIFPDDFPTARKPAVLNECQQIVTSHAYVPAQNRYGGFVYGGGTMAFTAGYWALDALKPREICYFGCDMVYPKNGATHFYGTGKPDPLRADPTLANLSAKACRLEYFASEQGCAMVNLSKNRSVLPYQCMDVNDLTDVRCAPRYADPRRVDKAIWLEAINGYFVESGKYWEANQTFEPSVIKEIDQSWLSALSGLQDIDMKPM